MPLFKSDPTLVLSVLEQLKADSSLYVRKSVANNLNDIAKDHPLIVLETARRWKDVCPHTDWIVRQGCRTLIRKADPGTMELFGYANPKDVVSLTTFASLSVLPSRLAIGENSELHYELCVREGESVRIRIEYGIDFVKARGNTSRKLFLLSDKTVSGGTRVTGRRAHSWSDLTTRRHYPGEHRIALLVNGCEVASMVLVLHLLEESI
ncbi:yhaZ [Desulfosporosinus sp. OT]|uniref:yhaZ n=1 Tax=Desulfosporosinus sp. OT TaxID=913865 RepID=UPI000223A058|nr:yhaZ [Desulfosporosinus sp. OT]EGW37282.1 yhaZ [Desulfosporosinus sp. OT]